MLVEHGLHSIPTGAGQRLRLERARFLPGHFVVSLLQPLPLLRVPHDLGLDASLDHVPLLQRLEPVGEQISLRFEAPEAACELVAKLQLGLGLLVLVLAQLGRLELLGLYRTTQF